MSLQLNSVCLLVEQIFKIFSVVFKKKTKTKTNCSYVRDYLQYFNQFNTRLKLNEDKTKMLLEF